MRDAEYWIRALQLRRHPEGGWFREIYRARETFHHEGLPSRFSGDRHFSTAIYFLLNKTEFSALHRIRQDELWHFYDGASLTIHQISPDGAYSTARLGRNVEAGGAGENLVAVIEGGCLFGATVDDPNSFSLVGCTVAPGFDFEDFEMPSRKQLLAQYPQHHDVIVRLTR